MITVLIPILNEEKALKVLFKKLDQPIYRNNSIIFCDAGSNDNSISLINSFIQNTSHRLISKKLTSPSVLSTLLLAKHEIRSEYILIHPVDSFPAQIPSIIKGEYAAFYKEYNPTNILLSLQSFVLNNLDLKLRHNFVWTNTPIIQTKVFQELTPFANGFLEDLQISDYLKENFQIEVLKDKSLISSRRYKGQGTLKQIFINLRVMIGFRLLKQDVQTLKKIYKSNNS